METNSVGSCYLGPAGNPSSAFPWQHLCRCEAQSSNPKGFPASSGHKVSALCPVSKHCPGSPWVIPSPFRDWFFFFFFYPAFQHWLTKSQREPMNGLLKVEEMKLVFPVVRCLGCIGTGCTWCKSERKCIHPFTACDPLDYERNQVEWPALCDQALPEMNVCASLLPPVFCTRSVPGVAHLSAG